MFTHALLRKGRVTSKSTNIIIGRGVWGHRKSQAPRRCKASPLESKHVCLSRACKGISQDNHLIWRRHWAPKPWRRDPPQPWGLGATVIRIQGWLVRWTTSGSIRFPRMTQACQWGDQLPMTKAKWIASCKARDTVGSLCRWPNKTCNRWIFKTISHSRCRRLWLPSLRMSPKSCISI